MNPKALIFSDSSLLAAKLADFLRSKNCEVSVNTAANTETPFANYVFIIEGFQEDQTSLTTTQISEKFSRALLYVKSTGAKSVVVIPKNNNLPERILSEYLKLWNLFLPVIVLENNPAHFDDNALNQIARAAFSFSAKSHLPIDNPKPVKVQAVKPIKAIESIKKVKPPKIHAPRKPIKKKPIIFAIGTLTFIILFPFFLTFSSLLSLNFGYRQILAGNFSGSKKFLQLSDGLSGFTMKMLGPVSSWPVFSLAYDSSRIANRGSKLGEDGLEVYTKASLFAQRFFDDQAYDLQKLSTDLALDLEKLYTNISFLETEAGNVPFLNTQFAKNLTQIKEVKRYLAGSQKLVANLPDLLGDTVTKRYLVLLQNNMELRPTGGFIGSFAIISFEKGKLGDFSVMDVYSADGQLKGHVEPPAPIKNYLGEANWFLRDSNWDPDFATSAARAEWFLDKELDRSVDGVVAIDLEFVKKILQITGPIKLADFNQTIDTKNFYEKIQYQVENDFFPGSTQKKDLLSALAQELLTEVKTIDSKNYPEFAKAALAAFEGKDIQVFTHNTSVNAILEELNWTGGVKTDSDLWGGVVEANLGVNKANYFVKRKMAMNTVITGTEAVNYLTLTLINTAPANNTLKGRYKAYVRVLAPLTATFDGTYELTKLPDRQEAGLLVEVGPEETKEIKVSWKVPISQLLNQSEVSLHWRKQPGITGEETPFAWQVLTQYGNFAYNTILSKDFNAKIKLKK